MTPVIPDSGGRSAQPTPEAWTMRAEWRAEPPSLARAEAERAMDVLSRARADRPGDPPDTDDVPPVPDALRDRWAEAYGRPVAATDERARPAPREPAHAGGSMADWFGSMLRSRRLAWMGAAATAVVAAVWMLSPSGNQSGVSRGGTVIVATRGGGAGVDPAMDTDPVPIALIVPAAAERDRAAMTGLIGEAFPGRTLQVVTTADEAAGLARRAPQLVVVNLASGLVTAWRGGELADEFPAAGTRTPVGVIAQIESADDRLQGTPPPSQ